MTNEKPADRAIGVDRDHQGNEAIRERFDRMAASREAWQRKAAYYYQEQLRYFRFLVPEGLRVLEVGCGLGDLLAALKPARGLGIDLSEMMVKEASRRHRRAASPRSSASRRPVSG